VVDVGFDAVFAALHAIMLRAGAGMTVARDLPGDLELRTPETDPKTGAPGWFGTVTIKKTYVAYHLIPLYERPALAEGLSEALTKRRQGKTCFNFKKADPALFAELEALTAAAAGSISRRFEER
jgi:hypothetical protein